MWSDRRLDDFLARYGETKPKYRRRGYPSGKPMIIDSVNGVSEVLCKWPDPSSPIGWDARWFARDDLIEVTN